MLVKRAGEHWRGSGYLVAPGWVLTAAHVVAGAEAVAVWLGAPPTMDARSGSGVNPQRILSCQGADLALLPLDSPPAPVDRALFGQVERAGSAPVPAVAAGCPRFKLRPDPARPGRELRELHLAEGTIAAMSDVKTATLELKVHVIPADDPEPDKHSPWEGMSGAAVWVSGRLIGVIGQHHARQGNGVLTVRPLTGLFAFASDEELTAWRRALPQLCATADDLTRATSPSARELAAVRAQRDARQLVPGVLIGRHEELTELAAFARSPERWRWVQGAPFAGKTALLAWFALHPPEGVDIAACFLRRTTGRADARYAVDVLTRQLARIAQRPDYQPAPYLAQQVGDFTDCLEDAAMVCRQQGRRLLLLVDGLDEDQTVEPGLAVARWLPDAGTLPEDTWLLVSSRSGVHVPLPDGHPLRTNTRLLAPSLAASELEGLAREELSGTRTIGGLIYDLLGLLCAAVGGLTVPDFMELLQRSRQAAVSSVEITDTLEGSLARSVSTVADAAGPEERVWAFGHDALLDHARSLYARDLPHYYALLASWAQEYQQRGWPRATPQYLLRRYTGQLTSQALDPESTPEQRQQTAETLYKIVADPVRSARLLHQTSNPAVPDQEITEAQRALVAARDRGNNKAETELIYRLAILALARRPFVDTLDDVVALVSFVWAQAGRSRDAIAIAASIESQSQRALALAEVDMILAGNPRTSSRGHPATTGIGLPHARLRKQELGAAAVSMARDGHGDLAVRVADGILDPGQRVLAQAEVAVSLAQTGYRDLVSHVAFGTENPGQQGDALSELAVRLTRAGYRDRARQIASSIEDPWQRELVQVEVWVSETRTGLSGDAHKASHGAPPGGARSWARGAVSLAKTGYDDARQQASGIENPGQRARALCMVAVSLARNEHRDQAADVAGTIQHRRIRAIARARVAGTLADAQLADQAVSDAILVRDHGQRQLTLAEVAGILAWSGLSDHARRAVGAIEYPQETQRPLATMEHIEVFRRQKDHASGGAAGMDDNGPQPWALPEAVHDMNSETESDQTIFTYSTRSAARGLADAAAVLADGGLVEEAITTASRIADARLRARALADVAGNLARAGQLAQAIGISFAIDVPGPQLRALADIAASLSPLQAKEAKDITDQAERTAAAIEDPAARARALAKLAASLADAGQPELAADLAGLAAKICASFQNPKEWPKVLAEMAIRLIQERKGDLGNKLASRATIVAASIEEPRAGRRAQAMVADILSSTADRDQTDRSDVRKIQAQAKEMPVTGASQRAATSSSGQRRATLRLAHAGDADGAISAAIGITDPWTQTPALAEAAAILSRLGFIEQALEAVGMITDHAARARALNKVARTYNGGGKVRDPEMSAARLAQRRIARPKDRGKFANLLAMSVRADEAIGAAAGISDPGKRAEALAQIAGVLIQVGQPDQAIRAAIQIESLRQRARVLAIIALSAEGECNDASMDAVCEIMLSPYARDNMTALPVPVIERLAAEGQLK